ncbi:Fe(3+) ABC transporter substrate-binding protein [Leptodesmis sp.]|uniref:Fe(3+) ABC transporter substrate-binding protein n=1 Tax=Leptodesmis sp. TaxID=3100501 RepID=UPI00405349C9
MKMTRRAFLASGSAIAVVAMGGCGQKQESGSSQAKQAINLYSARHYDSDNALYAAFTKQSGIAINLVEAKADELIERIKSEGTNSPADVLMTVDAGNLWRAQQAGLFLPTSSQALQSAIPANLRDPAGNWFGFSKRARVIVYNKNRVKPADLSTYENLADPCWKGRFIVRSSSNVYNQSLTGSLLAANGSEQTEAWARGLVANFAHPPKGNDTAQIQEVAAGVADLTLVNTYYVVRLMESEKAEEREISSKVGVFFPNQDDRGTHTNISGGGVVKTAKNPEAAIQFLEFLATPEAQAIFAKGNNEYPVVAQVAIDPMLASLGEFKADPLDAAIYGQKNAEALKIMDRAGWT